jgi:RNA 3'-terminal phosphate cyclase (ATP)
MHAAVLQTVLPPLLLAGVPATVVVTGGTHNPLAPSADFLAETFLPALAPLGVRARLDVERCGFMPKGGGVVRLVLEAREQGEGALALLQRGPLSAASGVFKSSRRPQEVAMSAHAVMREASTVASRACFSAICLSANTCTTGCAAGNARAALVPVGQR